MTQGRAYFRHICRRLTRVAISAVLSRRSLLTLGLMCLSEGCIASAGINANPEFWSSFGFWALVIGLVGDVAVLTIPKNRDRLEKILSAFFTIVIIVGVAIERKADSEISRKTDLKIAILESDAKRFEKEAAQAVEKAATAESHLAEAKERAAKAETGAANAVKEAKEAGARALKFEASIASANARAKEAATRALKFEADIASSNARAEEARNIAERERLERVKLEAQVAPRRLSNGQQNAITTSVKRFSGRNVTVVTYSLDVETAVLANQIISALRRGGIVVEDKISSLLVSGSFRLGVQISGPVNEQDIVKALADSFVRDGKLITHNLGTQAVVPEGISSLREKAVFVFVAVKPPAP